MELIQIGVNSLKVMLTKDDMEELELCFENLDYKNKATRRALNSILAEARKTFGFDISDKLYIQAFKDKLGGCELFLHGEAEKREELFYFETIDVLILAAARLANCNFSVQSEAFAADSGGYYLLIYAESPLPLFIYELGKKRKAAAFLPEHSKLICENAVETLAALK